MTGFDAIVVGCGAMGSAACYHLARRGKRVLGLERFGIPNEEGSSHGFTRIIRLAYYESPDYVALLRRAYTLWRELETVAGERLLVQTGSIDCGAPDNWIFAGSVRSCVEHDLPHEVLDGHALTQRFPGVRFPSDMVACYQPDGGFLLPERCIVAHANAAMALGAELHGHEPVVGWDVTSDGVRVRTERGEYRAERLVLAAGAWMRELVPALDSLAVPERQVLAWFQPRRPELYQPPRFPVFNAEREEGRFYGFPVHGIPGFKIGMYHHRHEQGRPDELRGAPTAADEAPLRTFTERYFPDAGGPTLSLRTCLFTNTPDEHFIVDTHPELPEVIVASPCSGHGFKFASVIGEVLAELAADGASRQRIGLFRLDRLTGPRPAPATTA